MGFEVKERKMNIQELENKLRSHFNRIWRCADSGKWFFLKNTDLLTIDWIDQSMDYSTIDFNQLKGGKRALHPWVKTLKVGDLIFVMGKNYFNGIAIAESTYNNNGPFINMGASGDKPAIKVRYIFKCDNPISHTIATHNNPTTFASIDQYNFGLRNVLSFLNSKLPDSIKALEDYVENDNPQIQTREKDLKKQYTLNQILYGPPGTGKTYCTKELAVEIAEPFFFTQIDSKLTESDRRKRISDKYEDLFKSGQIVFTTFHQSMSYEDFVEGIKPKTINNEVQYEIEDGIFKLLCQKASVKNGNFNEIIEKLKHTVSELDGQPALTINYGNKNSFDLIYKGTTVFYVKPKNSIKENTWYPVNINNMRIAFETNEYGKLYNPTYIREILNYLVKEYGLVKGKENEVKNYVLIIDEINRGNVSSIFGELITLLEADKRIGETEQLFLDLPYSKNEKFGVPKNLYIIGTMNTADRSVESLDTALRRRFSFIEVMPEPKLLAGKKVGGIELDNLLSTINKRIEILLDRDHTIGHSYFFRIEDENDLKHTFKNSIIPLLQEYFYSDYEKIGLVLGSGFVTKIDKLNVVFPDFIRFNEYNSSRYELIPMDNDFNIVEAIDKLWK